MHRIREAMTRDALLVAFEGVVVADETWIGGDPNNRHGHRYGQGGQGRTDKTVVMALVDKDTGEARSRIIPDVSGATLSKTMAELGVDKADTILHTDGHQGYAVIAGEFLAHEYVDHGDGEYVRGDVTTNQAENFLLPTETVPRRNPPPRQPRAPAPVPRRVRLPVLHPAPVRRCPHEAPHGPDRPQAADVQAGHSGS